MDITTSSSSPLMSSTTSSVGVATCGFGGMMKNKISDVKQKIDNNWVCDQSQYSNNFFWKKPLLIYYYI